MNSLLARTLHLHRGKRFGSRGSRNRGSNFRRLITETLEDRRLLAAVPVLNISDVTAAEGDTGTTDFTFVVSLSEASSQEIAVDVNSTDGTATLANEDLLPVSPILRAEQNGRVVAEAENYTSRQSQNSCNWMNIPRENSGLGGLYANARGGEYMQLLPDGCGGASPPNPAGGLDIRTVIKTAGEYQLYTRWDGHGGSSDSIYAGIAELADGPGRDNADWWLYAGGGADANFATRPWDGDGSFEDNGAEDTGDPVLYEIPKPGIYTVRFWVREDGASVDSFVLQRSGLAPPVGDGPAVSPLSGKLTFAPGTTRQTVTVSVVGDPDTEPNETFFLDLSNATGGAVIGDGRGMGTIENDDFISINDATVSEGDSGTKDVDLTISLSQPFNFPVSVNYETTPGTGATAADSDDYVPKSDSVTFAAGETSKVVTVSVRGDTVPEYNESFFVVLSDATAGVGIGDGQGEVMIPRDSDGTIIVWTGAGDGSSWNVASNWDLNRVPATTDDVIVIPNVAPTTFVNYSGTATFKRILSDEPFRVRSGTLTLSGQSFLGGLTLGGTFSPGNLRANADLTIDGKVNHVGTIDGSGDVRVKKTYTWSGGAIGGNGTLYAEGGMRLDGFDKNLTGRTLVTGGTTNFTAGRLLIASGGELRNTGTFNLHAQQDISGGPVINDGTIAKISGSRSRIAGTFTNNGVIDARVGETSLTGNFTNFDSGSNTLTGGTYRVRNTLTFNSANIVTNAAAIELEGTTARIENTSNSNALANFSTNAAGGSFRFVDRNFTTRGSLNNAGKIMIPAGTTLNVSGNFTQSAGSTELQGGTLDPSGNVILQGGVLEGSGTVSANIFNAGTIGAGGSGRVLNITGNYTQTAAGTLNVDIGDSGAAVAGSLVPQADQLNVTGTSSLDGTLTARLVGDFMPQAGAEFQTMTFASRTGDFSVKNLDLGGGVVATTIYEPSRMLLRVASPPPLVTGHSINAGNNNRSVVRGLAITFDQAVTVAAPSALRIFNLTTGAPINISSATLLNNGTAEVSWNLSSVTLPSGAYVAELPQSGALSTDSGQPLAVSYALPFHVLRGDDNGDRSVNFLDFGALSSNFGQAVGVLGPGDLDGNGIVNFVDFGILSAGFGRSLTPPTVDYGDAPAGKSYPTTAAENGARHIVSSLFLGVSVDGESDGRPSADADGDDTTGADDEDGVVFATLQAGASGNVTVTAAVPTGAAAVLNAWLDLNADGDWDDAGEQIFVDQALNNGANVLSVSVPANAAVGQTFARFRVTSTAGYSYNGLAPHGEVEDYAVTVVAASSSLSQARLPSSASSLWIAAQADQQSRPATTLRIASSPEARPVTAAQPPLGTAVVDQALADDSTDRRGLRSIQHQFVLSERLVDHVLAVEEFGQQERALLDSQ